MTPRRKYLCLLGGLLLAFAYLLMTEVAGRWGEVIDLHERAGVRENDVLDPERLIEKKMRLLARRKELTGRVVRSNAPFDQSMTGVYDFLTWCASTAGVQVESLTPSENSSEGEIRGLGFKINAKAEFHKVCAFISEMESGPMAVSLRKVRLNPERHGSSRLLAEIEGMAYVLQTGGR